MAVLLKQVVCPVTHDTEMTFYRSSCCLCFVITKNAVEINALALSASDVVDADEDNDYDERRR